jgi:DNA-binding beta-propeller fold protein YncE
MVTRMLGSATLFETIALVVLASFVLTVAAFGSAVIRTNENPTTREADLVDRVSASRGNAIEASCPVYQPFLAAFDPADGLVYVEMTNGNIVVVKPPCTPLTSIGGGAYGVPVYDSTLKLMVLIPTAFNGSVAVYVVAGTSLIATVTIISSYYCPFTGTWDPDANVVLITSLLCAQQGITVIHLSLVNGIVEGSAQQNVPEFDNGAPFDQLLVADGYIFAASGGVVGPDVWVYNATTFTFVGAYSMSWSILDSWETLAWDPLRNAVIWGLAEPFVPTPTVLFLEVKGIPAGHFGFYKLKANEPNFLSGGAGSVAYSPSTRQIYITAAGGNDVWEVSNSGKLSHVYLGKLAGPSGLAYDSANGGMYVCATDASMLYLID